MSVDGRALADRVGVPRLGVVVAIALAVIATANVASERNLQTQQEAMRARQERARAAAIIEVERALERSPPEARGESPCYIRPMDGTKRARPEPEIDMTPTE